MVLTPDPRRLLGASLSDIEKAPALAGALDDVEEVGKQLYFDKPELGLSFVADGAGVTAVLIYCRADGAYAAFNGDLPHGLTSGMSRPRVRELLGAPESSGEEKMLPLLGMKPAWDRFRVKEGFVHVSYRLHGPGLSVVTLMTQQGTP